MWGRNFWAFMIFFFFWVFLKSFHSPTVAFLSSTFIRVCTCTIFIGFILSSSFSVTWIYYDPTSLECFFALSSKVFSASLTFQFFQPGFPKSSKKCEFYFSLMGKNSGEAWRSPYFCLQFFYSFLFWDFGKILLHFCGNISAFDPQKWQMSYFWIK